MRQNDKGIRRGFSRAYKMWMIIMKYRRPLNVVFTASELKPTSISSRNFPFWFEIFMKKKIIKAFKTLKLTL